MTAKEATAWRGTRRLSSIIIKEIVQHLCENSKPPVPKIAVLTEKTYKLNGSCTKLLEISRQTFRLEEHGLRHASGALFKLDRHNYQKAASFLCGGIS